METDSLLRTCKAARSTRDRPFKIIVADRDLLRAAIRSASGCPWWLPPRWYLSGRSSTPSSSYVRCRVSRIAAIGLNVELLVRRALIDRDLKGAPTLIVGSGGRARAISEPRPAA